MHRMQRSGFRCPGQSMCLDTAVSPAETAVPIEMLYGLWTGMGPRNSVLGGSLDPPEEVAIFVECPTPLQSIGRVSHTRLMALCPGLPG